MLLLSLEGQRLMEQAFEEGTFPVALGKEYLQNSDLFFLSFSDGSIKCYSGTTLNPRLLTSCQQLTADPNLKITAFSTFGTSEGGEYLLVAYD